MLVGPSDVLADPDCNPYPRPSVRLCRTSSVIRGFLMPCAIPRRMADSLGMGAGGFFRYEPTLSLVIPYPFPNPYSSCCLTSQSNMTDNNFPVFKVMLRYRNSLYTVHRFRRSAVPAEIRPKTAEKRQNCRSCKNSEKIAKNSEKLRKIAKNEPVYMSYFRQY